MITKRRVVIWTLNQRVLNEVAQFEAMKVIESEGEAGKVWGLNKTPIIFGKGALEVPNFGECDFEKTFTAWAHAQGFEPGERISGKRYNTAKEACVLCSIARYGGRTDNPFTHNATVQKEVDVILYESDNFLVTSELGALKKGFLMICPRNHYLSVAQFPEELYPEYDEVCEDVEEILIRTFGNAHVSFFEHGSGPSGYTSHPKSIVHAHTHVLWGWCMQDRFLNMIQAKPIEDIKWAAASHYFSYKVGSHGRLYCCYDPQVFVPRQFARQVIAEELGLSPGLFNWRRFDFAENINITLYYIWRMLKTEANLRDRIRERTECFTIGYSMREH